MAEEQAAAQGDDRRRIGHVDGQPLGACALGAQGRGGLQCLLLVEVRQQDHRALGGEAPAESQADAPGAPGDQDPLVSQFAHVVCPFRRLQGPVGSTGPCRQLSARRA